MPKYNWAKVKRKFMTGNYKSLVDFSNKEKIDYKRLRRHSSGWVTEKRTLTAQKESKIQEKLISSQIDRAVNTNERHIALWDKLLNIIEDTIADNENLSNFKGNAPLYKAISAIATIVSDAQKGQRLALDMDRNNNGSDEKIEEMIALLAEAVRETGNE